jgi:mono/diheme cytochrome c family protein
VATIPANGGSAARGKVLFKSPTLPGGKPGCGTCHTLANAGTTGVVGPNLDDAFRYAKLQGFKESTIRDVVRGQIAYATSNTGVSVKPSGKAVRGPESPGMPDNLLQGQQAKDVAIYVAKCAAVPHCVVGG